MLLQLCRQSGWGAYFHKYLAGKSRQGCLLCSLTLPMGSFGAFSQVSVCYGMLWGAMGCYGVLWDAMGCYGMLWDPMGSYGMLWDPYRMLWDPYRMLWDAMATWAGGGQLY
jgi:hypothetical protein